MHKRKSSDIRIKTGTALSGNLHLVYLSTTFALSTAIKHDLILKDKFHHIFKYSISSLCLSLPYFTLNEEITHYLSQISVKNYFVSHSLTSLSLFPFFTLAQRLIMGHSWKQSRFLSYRYLGTICCFSLVGELIISTYRHSVLDNINLDLIDAMARDRRARNLNKKVDDALAKANS